MRAGNSPERVALPHQNRFHRNRCRRSRRGGRRALPILFRGQGGRFRRSGHRGGRRLGVQRQLDGHIASPQGALRPGIFAERESRLLLRCPGGHAGIILGPRALIGRARRGRGRSDIRALGVRAGFPARSLPANGSRIFSQRELLGLPRRLGLWRRARSYRNGWLLLERGGRGESRNRRRSLGQGGALFALDREDLFAGKIFVGEDPGVPSQPGAAGALLAGNVSQALRGYHSGAEYQGRDDGRNSHYLSWDLRRNAEL